MQQQKILLNPQTIKIQDLISKLKSSGNMDYFFMEECIKKSSSLLKKQPNVLSLSSPTIVIGDIHGQFYDLQNILHKFSLKNHNFLFLGDYVDRGLFCIQVITLLMVLKIQRPGSVHLLRGNHESKSMTSQYNFKQQCCKKYSIQTYQKVLDWFKLLPLAAVIDNKYFCVHGGILPDFNGINELQKIQRNIEIPDSGIMCDLMWSDPIDDEAVSQQKNSIRGVSYFFIRKIASKFLKQNEFEMIIRAHELHDQGYKFQQIAKGKKYAESYTLTLFSTHTTAISSIKRVQLQSSKYNNKIFIEKFSQVQHPTVLPGYMNVFKLSLPYISICIDHLARHLTKSKKKTKTSLHPIKEITAQMRQYLSLQFIRELFEKTMINKNQSFPAKHEEKIQPPNKVCTIHQIKNKQNSNVPGPFNTKFSKIKQKLLTPVLQSSNSLGTSSDTSLEDQNTNN